MKVGASPINRLKENGVKSGVCGHPYIHALGKSTEVGAPNTQVSGKQYKLECGGTPRYRHQDKPQYIGLRKGISTVVLKLPNTHV